MPPFSKIHDISVLLGEESITYPGDPEYQREFVFTIADSGICNVSRLSMSAHTGTHLDAPLHFVEGGKSIDQFSPAQFILPAVVIDIHNKTAVYPTELESAEINEGDAVLFRTENSLSGRCKSGVFSEDYVYVSPAAAEFCAEKRVRLIGIDYITIEKHRDETFPSHHIILGNDIFILEGVNLLDIKPGRYTLCCLPLKIKGGEASPARAVLLE